MTFRLRALTCIVAGITLSACSEQEAETDAAATADTGTIESTQPAAGTTDIASADGSAGNETNSETGEWQHPMTSWGEPDLSGMWPIHHLITTPLIRPQEYGERFRFTEAELDEQRAALERRNTRYEQEDAEDRIGMGHWAEESDLPAQTSLIVEPADGQFPALTEEGRRMAATMGSSWTVEEFDGIEDFDAWDRCITRGLPTSMFPAMYNNGVEIVQAPGYVVINLEMIHEARIIPVGDHDPLDSDVKQWLGDSRGHWEGNTLVVETTNFNGEAEMLNVGLVPQPGMVPTSTEMRLTERFERSSDNELTYTITVEDPVVLTQPWTASLPWQLDNSYEFFEYACNEDNYTIRDYITTSRFQASQAEAE